MGVLFGFRNAQLLQSRRRGHLAQRVLGRPAQKGHRQIKRCVIFGHTAVMQLRKFRSGKLSKISLGEGPRNLPRPVSPEVEENHRVAVQQAAILIRRQIRLHKFIRHPSVIAGLQGCRQIRRPRRVGFTQHQRAPGSLHPIPTLISIHRPKTAANQPRLTIAGLGKMSQQLLQITQTAGGRHIAPIQKAMHVSFRHSLLLSQLQQSQQMLKMAMHAAVGKQAQQVQAASFGLSRLTGSQQLRILSKIPVGYGLINGRQILVNHSACANIQMPHFGIAHQPRRQAHRQTTSRQLSMRAALPERVKIRQLSQRKRIARQASFQAPAIQNAKHNRFLHI